MCVWQRQMDVVPRAERYAVAAAARVYTHVYVYVYVCVCVLFERYAVTAAARAYTHVYVYVYVHVLYMCVCMWMYICVCTVRTISRHLMYTSVYVVFSPVEMLTGNHYACDHC